MSGASEVFASEVESMSGGREGSICLHLKLDVADEIATAGPPPASA